MRRSRTSDALAKYREAVEELSACFGRALDFSRLELVDRTSSYWCVVARDAPINPMQSGVRLSQTPLVSVLLFTSGSRGPIERLRPDDDEVSCALVALDADPRVDTDGYILRSQGLSAVETTDLRQRPKVYILSDERFVPQSLRQAVASTRRGGVRRTKGPR